MIYNENEKRLNEMIDDEKLIKLRKEIAIRNNIISFIGKENLVNELRKIIDESEKVDFKDNNSRIFINKDNPEFVLKLNKPENENFPEVKNQNDDKNMNKYVEKVQVILTNEIINKTTIIINKFIRGNEEFEEIVGEDFDFDKFIISNMYTIRASVPRDNIIFLSVIF
ncbi:hypothetical protein FPHOBKDP_00087 [Listeria phage LPJP1]|nr:hypothetical protein FPHOBKDP_00087 [Listeria phage LPJP1]